MTNDRPKPIKRDRVDPVQPQSTNANRLAKPTPKPITNTGDRHQPAENLQDFIPLTWLKEVAGSIAKTADTFVGFPEYLRWMRESSVSGEASHNYKDTTKIQVLQLAAEKSTGYQDRLKELTERTKLMAGKDNTFLAKSTWRLRVGGHRGPESILLPAFDALGIPYLPSSTLRGVARNQGIRELMKTMEYKEAVKEIAPYFGSILQGRGSANDTKNRQDRSGKVIFFDAYPIPSKSEVLAVDMANNIWKWDGKDLPKYNPNPNPFLSLKEQTFLVGLKKMANCDDATFDRVKGWAIAGLQAGVGSQINSGYGETIVDGESKPKSEIIRVQFHLEGQLIHGQQRIVNLKEPFKRNRDDGELKRNNNGLLQANTIAVAEVRPIAFKSMLRYWFRAFSLGVLPVSEVQTLEGRLFGTITPKQQQGWLKFNIAECDDGNSQPAGKDDDVREQSGILIISYSTAEQPQGLEDLIKNLTWIMFHLGGIGQGARRPRYYRGDRKYPKPPFYRGSTLFPSGDSFWTLPREVAGFQTLFQRRLTDFYTALAAISQQNIDPQNLREAGTSSLDTWQQSIDLNCQIVVCAGTESNHKPFALACLHSPELKDGGEYDPNLCGTTRRGKGESSPVWICDLGDYQVVTVFGANVNTRQKYLEKLRQDSDDYQQIFPFQ
jgi:CRISPR-associated protein Cmr6